MFNGLMIHFMFYLIWQLDHADVEGYEWVHIQIDCLVQDYS